MNPYWFLKSTLRQDFRGVVLLTTLIALSMGLGVAVVSQERALRKGSAKAAENFDLLIGAQGSPTQLLLSTVYLQPRAVSLISIEILHELQQDPRVEVAVPLAFGDSWQGHMIVGTETAFLTSGNQRPLQEGRIFTSTAEAVVGARVPLALGETFVSQHGSPEEVQTHELMGTETEDHTTHPYTVVGRLEVLGTPWDWAIIVPVEGVWLTHGIQPDHSEFSHSLSDAFASSSENTEDDKTVRSANLPSIPAIVVKPRSVADAYQLRAQYRSSTTQAFFPAEVLVELYQTLGDVRDLMSILAWLTQLIVIVAVSLTILTTLELKKAQLALLRAFGASRGYLFLAIWLYIGSLVSAGVLAGLGIGWGLASGLSYVFAQQSGLFLPVQLAWPEWRMALILLVSGMVLAVFPSWSAYRQSVRTSLQF